MPTVVGARLLAVGIVAALVATASPATAGSGRPDADVTAVLAAPTGTSVAGSLIVTFAELAPAIGAQPEDPGIAHASAVGSTQSAAREAADAVGGDVDGVGSGIAVLEVEPGSEEEAAQTLLARGDVVAVERDNRISAAYTPSDSLWSHSTGLAAHQVERVWDLSTGARDVVIAVVDSGVTETSDLQGRIVPGYDVIDQDASWEDGQGHGTQSAHVAAAAIDNEVGTAGVCPRCSVMPVRVLDDEGNGTESNLVLGLDWAVAHGADVVNMSLGGPFLLPSAEAAIERARQAGVVVVAAAGNQATTAPFYPAAYDGVLSVGALDEAMSARASYSNHGPAVDVAASGTNVAGRPDGLFVYFSGTSSAAPVVSGIAGLLLSCSDGLTPSQVASAITSTSSDVSWVTHGVVDAAAAYATAVGAPVPDETAAVSGTQRLAGADRYATAACASAAAFDPGVPRAYIATGANFPDGLSAAAAAAAAGGPVLLSAGSSVPTATLDELQRLKPQEIVLVGGTGVLTQAVERRLAKMAPVRRVAGGDRYATAARVAVEAFGTASTVYLASGATFADALAGGPAAAGDGAPVLLTAPSSLPDVTAEAIDELDARDVVVLGGTAAVSKAVMAQLDELGVAVRRIAGETRYATAAKIAADANPDGVDRVVLASGTGFADALGGGAAAAALGAALLTVHPDRLPHEAATALQQLAPAHAIVLGGKVAVSADVLAQVTAARR